MKITRKGFLSAVAGGGVVGGLGSLRPFSLFAAAQAEKKRRPTITSIEAAPFSVPLRGVAKLDHTVPPSIAKASFKKQQKNEENDGA